MSLLSKFTDMKLNFLIVILISFSRQIVSKSNNKIGCYIHGSCEEGGDLVSINFDSENPHDCASFCNETLGSFDGPSIYIYDMLRTVGQNGSFYYLMV